MAYMLNQEVTYIHTQVSIIILAHLIGVLGQQCNGEVVVSDLTTALFIKHTLLLTIFSISNSILSLVPYYVTEVWFIPGNRMLF